MENVVKKREKNIKKNDKALRNHAREDLKSAEITAQWAEATLGVNILSLIRVQ